MSNLLSELLSERRWLMADGATGTTLFAMGLEAGDAPELWNIDAPEKIRALHQGFVDAGSDIILTNSFGGTRHRLKLHKADNRVRELNAAAARIAREVADKAGRPVVVAGSIGPTGELLEPVGALSFDDAVSAFKEQAEGLLEGGADVLWAETISSREEIAAIQKAAADLGAPFCGTLSFDSSGRTMMGLTSTDYARQTSDMTPAPVAFGANCGVGASDLLRSVLGLTEKAPEAVVIAKANAGIPKYVDGAIEYDGTPALMGDYAVMALRAGARIIGGCCGTTTAHLEVMKKALTEAPEALSRPTLDEIEAATGPFSSEGDGVFGHAGHAAPKARRGGRRRAGGASSGSA
ncbi:MAG: betaine--homocysteine S-methyltransferase [Neomegalonema sp.]|nr:betaine--homocysteine S-methyltransferase [Neomegalonema sp.]